MTVVEAECYTPIPGDRYNPKTSEVSPDWMQTEARDVHIARPTVAVEYRQDIAKFFNMRGSHFPCRSPIIKAFEPPMFKRPDNNSLL